MKQQDWSEEARKRGHEAKQTGQRETKQQDGVFAPEHTNNQSPCKVKTPRSKGEGPLPEWRCRAWPQTCFFKAISSNQRTLMGQKLRTEESAGSWPTRSKSRSGVGGQSLEQAPPTCTPAPGSPAPFTFYGLFDAFVRICSSFSPVFALGFPGFAR